MSLRDDHRFNSPGPDGEPQGGPTDALVLAALSAVSGAAMSFLLAGHGFAAMGIVVAALAASWIGWWARGLS